MNTRKKNSILYIGAGLIGMALDIFLWISPWLFLEHGADHNARYNYVLLIVRSTVLHFVLACIMAYVGLYNIVYHENELKYRYLIRFLYLLPIAFEIIFWGFLIISALVFDASLHLK
jgi:hypothetical protein